LLVVISHWRWILKRQGQEVLHIPKDSNIAGAPELLEPPEKENRIAKTERKTQQLLL
jgi:hypothetical protein